MDKKRKSVNPFDPPNLLTLDEDLQDLIQDHFGYRSPYRKQLTVVQELEGKLAVERQKLEHLAKPLLSSFSNFTPDAMAALAKSQPWDGQLKVELGRVKLKERDWVSRKDKPTGAKTWKELRDKGGTDEQIYTNIKNLPDSRHSRDKQFAVVGTDFVCFGAETDYGGRQTTKLVAGKQALIREVRRVMGIGEPTKAAAAEPMKASPTKPAKKKSTKKKAAKKKPAAKTSGVGAKPHGSQVGAGKPKGGMTAAARERRNELRRERRAAKRREASLTAKPGKSQGPQVLDAGGPNLDDEPLLNDWQGDVAGERASHAGARHKSKGAEPALVGAGAEVVGGGGVAGTAVRRRAK